MFERIAKAVILSLIPLMSVMFVSSCSFPEDIVTLASTHGEFSAIVAGLDADVADCDLYDLALYEGGGYFPSDSNPSTASELHEFHDVAGNVLFTVLDLGNGDISVWIGSRDGGEHRGQFYRSSYFKEGASSSLAASPDDIVSALEDRYGEAFGVKRIFALEGTTRVTFADADGNECNAGAMRRLDGNGVAYADDYYWVLRSDDVDGLFEKSIADVCDELSLAYPDMEVEVRPQGTVDFGTEVDEPISEAVHGHDVLLTIYLNGTDSDNEKEDARRLLAALPGFLPDTDAVVSVIVESDRTPTWSESDLIDMRG